MYCQNFGKFHWRKFKKITNKAIKMVKRAFNWTFIIQINKTWKNMKTSFICSNNWNSVAKSKLIARLLLNSWNCVKISNSHQLSQSWSDKIQKVEGISKDIWRECCQGDTPKNKTSYQFQERKRQGLQWDQWEMSSPSHCLHYENDHHSLQRVHVFSPWMATQKRSWDSSATVLISTNISRIYLHISCPSFRSLPYTMVWTLLLHSQFHQWKCKQPLKKPTGN